MPQKHLNEDPANANREQHPTSGLSSEHDQMGLHRADHYPCITRVHARIHAVFLRTDVPHLQWRSSFAARDLSRAFRRNGFEFRLTRHDDSRFVFAVIPKSKYETHVGHFDSGDRRDRLDSVYF